MSEPHTEDKLKYQNNAIVAVSEADWNAPCIKMRAGLQNSAGKFLREKVGRVAFLGGSITQMPGWSHLTETHLRERFADVNFEFTNAAIGGTNSTFGVFRFDQDVLAKASIPIDLMFLEFAVNDRGDLSLVNQSLQAMEGIIRKARKSNPAMDIIVLYFVDEAKVEAYRQRKEPAAITHHERIMVHYGIPVINLALEMTRRLDAGAFSWDNFSADSCHPTPFGHEQYMECIRQFLDSAWGIPTDTVRDYDLPAPLFVDHLASARLIGPESAHGWTMVKGWLTNKVCNYSGPVDVLTATKVGEIMTLTFDGTSLAISAIAGMDAGVLEIRMDGGAAVEKDLFDNYTARFHRPVFHVLAHNLPAGQHTIKLRIAARHHPESTGYAARILQFGVT